MKQQKGQNLPDTTMLLEFQMHCALKVTKQLSDQDYKCTSVKYKIIYKLIYNAKAKWFIFPMYFTVSLQ